MFEIILNLFKPFQPKVEKTWLDLVTEGAFSVLQDSRVGFGILLTFAGVLFYFLGGLHFNCVCGQPVKPEEVNVSGGESGEDTDNPDNGPGTPREA